MQRVLCVCVRNEKSWSIELNETKSQYLKAQICAKTHKLVKCGTRVKEVQSPKLFLCINMKNEQ